MNRFQFFSLRRLYMFWVLLIIFYTLISMASGEYYKVMSQALAGVEAPATVTHETMVKIFMAITLLFTGFILALGNLFLAFAEKNRLWAKWALLIFLLWQLKESTWGAYRISKMYSTAFGLKDFLGSTVLVIVLLLALWKTIRLIQGPPNYEQKK